MSAYTPKLESRRTFGLWTVGRQARAPFGDASRVTPDPAESVHRFAEPGAYGAPCHDGDLLGARG